jgi:hypothetical protein
MKSTTQVEIIVVIGKEEATGAKNNFKVTYLPGMW